MSDDSSRPPRIPRGRRKLTPEAGAARPGEDVPEAVPEITPLDAARYLAEMTAELSRFARRYELSTLAYFLEMAHIEAADQARLLES